MRLIRLDKKTGVAKLKIQTLEDLWHLGKILEAGDLVRSRTLRKTAIVRPGKIEKGERKPITLVLKLEKAEYSKDFGLRALGTIERGPEDVQLHSHHSLSIRPGMAIGVKKRWRSWQLERIKKSQLPEPAVLICAIDREEASFAMLKEEGIDYQGSKTFHKEKGKEEDRSGFYGSILEHFKREKAERIIVCGPGFERENLAEFIKKKDPEVAKKIIQQYASYAGSPGIEEVVKTGNKIIEGSRLAREAGFVERLLLGLKKGELAAYGKKDVEKAVEYGAVDTLLVSDEMMKEFEDLIGASEKVGARLVIISREHEKGEQFFGLGGIGALLRFRIRE